MSPARMSRVEAAIRVVLEFREAFNRHDVGGMMKLMTEDCVCEFRSPAPDGTRYVGKDAVTQFWRDYFHDTPEAHLEVEDAFSLGLRCVLRWRCEWSDAGGEKVHLRGVDIYQIRDGLISERLSYSKG